MTERPHPDVLALRASLPAPGWTVLDTAREQRFTGELRAHTDDGADYHVYVDRGEVYCAERSTDPTLGVRLVEAGAINAAQFEYGVLRIGDIEHLGRLFDRVPSINRDAVFVLNQLMTEETMRSMAARSITDVEATPYRHHPSGMHRWTTLDLSRTPAPWGEVPELALPAPAPDARPVSDHEPPAAVEAPSPTTAGPTPAAPTNASTPASSPASADSSTPANSATTAQQAARAPTIPEARAELGDDLFVDDVVQWDEPSLLVSTTTTVTAGATTHERRELFPSSPPLGTTDWIDELGPDGVADAPAAPATHAKLPPVAVPPVEQFEVIWPSGEVDDVTTARNDLQPPAPMQPPGDGATHDADAAAGTDESDAPADTDGVQTDDRDDTDGTDGTDSVNAGDHGDALPRRTDDRDDASSDDRATAPPSDALAVRRAVATIDTGSLAVRRRLATPGADVPAPPGRLIVGRDHHHAWRNDDDRPTGSVFDAQPAEQFDPPSADAPAPGDQERRVGALRRLIGSLRKSDD